MRCRKRRARPDDRPLTALTAGGKGPDLVLVREWLAVAERQFKIENDGTRFIGAASLWARLGVGGN